MSKLPFHLTQRKKPISATTELSGLQCLDAEKRPRARRTAGGFRNVGGQQKQ